METIGFIGGGNMAEALIKGIINAGLYKPKCIFASDVLRERLDYLAKTYGVQTENENSAIAAKVDVLILSVKPQKMVDVLNEIKSAVRPVTLIISIAAGKTLAGIGSVLTESPLVRVMPNTPALVGQGASGLFANEKGKPLLEKALWIFSSVGIAAVVETEHLIDAVTAVSGSGPAYYFFLMEEMIHAGVELGLSAEVAKKLVLQTAKGAAMLAVEADKENQSPAELRRRVTSPGGTTQAAIEVFEKNNLPAIINAAIKRAQQRSKELSA